MSFYIHYIQSVYAVLPYIVFILQIEQIEQYRNVLYLHLIEINVLSKVLTYRIRKPNCGTKEGADVLTFT